MNESELWTLPVPGRERSRSPVRNAPGAVARDDDEAGVPAATTTTTDSAIRSQGASPVAISPAASFNFQAAVDSEIESEVEGDSQDDETPRVELQDVPSDFEEDITDDMYKAGQQEQQQHSQQQQQQEQVDYGFFDDEDAEDLLQDFENDEEVKALLGSIDVDSIWCPETPTTPHPDLCTSSKKKVLAYRERLKQLLSPSSKETLLNYIIRMLKLKVEVDFPRTKYNEMLKDTHEITLGEGNLAPTSLAMVSDKS